MKKKKINEMMRFKQGIYTADTTNGVQYYGTEEYSDLKYMEEVDPVEFFETLDSLEDDRTIYTVFSASEKPIWLKINKKFGIYESDKKKKDTIEIQEEVVIEQENQKVILEKGDKIRVLKEKKVPASWDDHEELAMTILDALLEEEIKVRFEPSDYENTKTISIFYEGERFELNLYKIM